VVQERHPVRGQPFAELREIGPENIEVGMYQRVEAEGEVDRLIYHHRQGLPIIYVVGDISNLSEPTPARLDARFAQIHNDQVLRFGLKELRPASVSGRDFQDRVCW
jgi:hypothetical protein